MKKILTVALYLLYYVQMYAQSIDENAIPNQYIIQFDKGVNVTGEFFEGRSDVVPLECLSKNMQIWLIHSPDDLIKALADDPDVKVVQHNHSGIRQRSLVANDSLFNMQWNMLNTSAPGADISATEAWQINHSNVTRLGDSIVIAVIDGGLGDGFDIYHPDINFFVNKNEIPNNGIDDDGNGYIDDYHGWNIFSNNDSVYNTSGPHATHVSGIAGGIGNNGIGVAGVCWGAKILAINGSSTYESEVIKAYDYVIEMRKLYDQTSGAKGAFIIATNSSFGVDAGQPANYPIWCAMYDSMGRYGILSATATANQGWNVDAVGDIPTTCPSKWLIAVTNTTSRDVLNSYAAYGPMNVDIAAPGTGIVSCFPNGDYGLITGTSMSTPHISGALAALFANACPRLMQDYFANPDSLALVLKKYLLQSSDPLSSLQNKIASGGRLNLYHAYIAEDSYNCNNCSYNISISQQDLHCYGDSTGTVTVSTNIHNHYRYLWSNGDTTATIAALGAGFYQVTVTDPGGCQRQISTSIPNPHAIVVNSLNIIAPTGSSAGNTIVGASASGDSLSYAIDTASYSSDAIFVTNETGSHTIHIKNQSGCVFDTVVYIFFAGINGVNNDRMIYVYPNPSNGKVYFSGLMSECDIKIYDMLGQNIVSYKCDRNSIDLRAYGKGMYIYKISQQSGIVQQGKIILE